MRQSPFVYFDAKIEALAMSWIDWIRSNKPEASSVAVLKLSLKAYINFLMVAIITVGISILTGQVSMTILAILAFPTLRYFSGGIHLNSSSKCAFLSAIIVFICVYTPITYWYNGLIITLVSIVILGLYAPSGIKQSKMKKENYPILKVIAIGIVSSNFIFHSPVVSMAFFAQAVTTIPVIGRGLKRMNL